MFLLFSSLVYSCVYFFLLTLWFSAQAVFSNGLHALQKDELPTSFQLWNIWMKQTLQMKVTSSNLAVEVIYLYSGGRIIPAPRFGVLTIVYFFHYTFYTLSGFLVLMKYTF